MNRQPRPLALSEGYALWSESYDDEQNPLIMVEEPRVEALLQRLPLPSRVLDAGTGTGRWALRLAAGGSEVTGIDASLPMLELARQKAERAGLPLHFEVGDLQQTLPFPDCYFDLVLCALALCHVPDLRGPIGEMARVTAPGGHLLITDFHPQAVANGWDTTIHRRSEAYTLPTARHTRDGYLQALETGGCEVMDVEDVLVREQPEEAVLWGDNIDEFMRRFGDWPFCLLILARKGSSVAKNN